MKQKKRPVKLPEYYNSIDFLPILAWEKIHESGDMRWLLIKQMKLTKAHKVALAAVWQDIYNQYIKVFGYANNYKRILEKRLQIGLLNTRMIIEKDPSLQNFINRKKIELEKLMGLNKGSGGDIHKVKIFIESKFKFYIPLASISVREFYTYYNEAKNIK